MTTSPLIMRTAEDMRRLVGEWRAKGETVAFVPTMGALHSGHMALVDFARARARRVVVSIFVNPTQFGVNEDFDAYPRTWDADLARLTERAVDAVYAPATAHMYPEGFATTVSLTGPALGLETEFRPHFFSGVATVVTKLLLGVMADVAVFGEKDYQQLQVIRRLARDLQIPCAIEGAPTIRETDGLALSSRNVYLSGPERRIAPKLHETLQETANAIQNGRKAQDALDEAVARLSALGFVVDYVSLRNADTLAEVTDCGRERLRLLAAARLGRTRLIDNIAV